MRRLSVFAAFMLALEAHAAPTFVPLGFLPGGTTSFAYGVSADGSTVVGSAGDSASYEQAFRWTSGGGMVGLGILPGGVPGASRIHSWATGVSADGSTVVGSSVAASGYQAFRWTSDGGMVSLGLLDGITASGASGVSADGSTVVGSAADSSHDQAFRWTSGTGMVSLGVLPNGSVFSEAYAVSADGSTVVGSSFSVPGYKAFRWTSDGMVGLDTFPDGIEGGDFLARGISANGSTVVGAGMMTFGDGCFLWTSDGGMVSLGGLRITGGIGACSALGVSANGSRVVGFSLVETGNAAFVWDSQHGMRQLDQVLADLGIDLTGWTLNEATGISADGQTVVGSGIDPGGHTEAWLAVIPEPDAGALGMMALLALVASSRLRHARALRRHDCDVRRHHSALFDMNRRGPAAPLAEASTTLSLTASVAYAEIQGYPDAMRVSTGRVVEGKVVVEGEALQEGATVTVLAAEGDESFELSAEDEAELVAALKEADVGRVVDASQVLREVGRAS